MKSLDCRKQLLIAESELNRASLSNEWQGLVGEVHALSSRAKSIGSLVKAAATLVSGLSSPRSAKASPAKEKFSWWQAALKGAGLAGLFWSECRAKDPK